MAKKHNWVTNLTVVNRDIERATVAAICDCNHMTPATVAAMDAKLGLGDNKTDNLPDPVEVVDEQSVEWDAVEPTLKQLSELE